jgi:hypothetical protein
MQFYSNKRFYLMTSEMSLVTDQSINIFLFQCPLTFSETLSLPDNASSRFSATVPMCWSDEACSNLCKTAISSDPTINWKQTFYYHEDGLVLFMVFNATFNNIPVISWQSVLLVEEYTSPWTGFKLTTLVVVGTDCTGSCKSNYHMIIMKKYCTILDSFSFFSFFQTKLMHFNSNWHKSNYSF